MYNEVVGDIPQLHNFICEMLLSIIHKLEENLEQQEQTEIRDLVESILKDETPEGSLRCCDAIKSC